jgi:hypothetical protein
MVEKVRDRLSVSKRDGLFCNLLLAVCLLDLLFRPKKIETVSVNFCQTTRRYIPEDNTVTVMRASNPKLGSCCKYVLKVVLISDGCSNRLPYPPSYY